MHIYICIYIYMYMYIYIYIFGDVYYVHLPLQVQLKRPMHCELSQKSAPPLDVCLVAALGTHLKELSKHWIDMVYIRWCPSVQVGLPHFHKYGSTFPSVIPSVIPLWITFFREYLQFKLGFNWFQFTKMWCVPMVSVKTNPFHGMIWR